MSNGLMLLVAGILFVFFCFAFYRIGCYNGAYYERNKLKVKNGGQGLFELQQSVVAHIKDALEKGIQNNPFGDDLDVRLNSSRDVLSVIKRENSTELLLRVLVDILYEGGLVQIRVTQNPLESVLKIVRPYDERLTDLIVKLEDWAQQWRPSVLVVPGPRYTNTPNRS